MLALFRNAALAIAIAVLTITTSSGSFAAEDTPWTMGEIRKVDAEQGKLTVRHEEITDLDMPAMTMVFPVADPAMLDGLSEGAVREFQFGTQNGRMMILGVRERQ